MTEQEDANKTVKQGASSKTGYYLLYILILPDPTPTSEIYMTTSY